MAREIQRHPVRGTVTHVDFQVVDPDRPVSADVTVHAHRRADRAAPPGRGSRPAALLDLGAGEAVGDPSALRGRHQLPGGRDGGPYRPTSRSLPASRSTSTRRRSSLPGKHRGSSAKRARGRKRPRKRRRRCRRRRGARPQPRVPAPRSHKPCLATPVVTARMVYAKEDRWPVRHARTRAREPRSRVRAHPAQRRCGHGHAPRRSDVASASVR